MLIASDTPDDALRRMLASGEFAFEIEPPDGRRLRLAALNSAYLDACLNLRDVPTSASAAAIRAELRPPGMRRTATRFRRPPVRMR